MKGKNQACNEKIIGSDLHPDSFSLAVTVPDSLNPSVFYSRLPKGYWIAIIVAKAFGCTGFAWIKEKRRDEVIRAQVTSNGVKSIRIQNRSFEFIYTIFDTSRASETMVGLPAKKSNSCKNRPSLI